MTDIFLITGGARSGKSSFALKLASRYARKGFIATAVACDDEMSERIRRHREERGDSFVTVEEPCNIGDAIRRHAPLADCIVVDCITVWLGTVMSRYDTTDGTCPVVEDFLKQLTHTSCPLYIVTNEVGMGIVPENSLARRFRDLAGTVNQRIAACADTVVFMVSGLPITLKGNLDGFV